VVSREAEAEGRTLAAFGIVPTTVEAVAPGYLWPYRKAGQFAQGRGTEEQAEIPDMIAPQPMGPGSQHRPLKASGPAVGPDAASSRMGQRWGNRS